MKFCKSKFSKILLGVIGFYILMVILFIASGKRKSEEYYFMFFMSFVFVIGGMLGLKNKEHAFKGPPQNPLSDYKISYADDEGIGGIVGRLINILVIIMGAMTALSMFFDL